VSEPARRELTTRDGRTLSWREVGEGDLLVCHPGGPGMSAAYFGDDLAEMGATRRLVLLDPRGTGGSDEPVDGAYPLAGYADDLEELRQHLGVDRFDLLGHSHGGFVAINYASQYANCVRSLILVCSAPRFSPELRDEAAARFRDFADRSWFEQAMQAMQARRERRYANRESLRELYVDEFRLWFEDERDWSAFIESWGDDLPQARALEWFNDNEAPTYDQRDLLPRITAATLVLNAADDFLGPRISAAELQEGIPRAEVTMLARAGHFPFAECAAREPFCAAAERFLGSA
jgi:pimeloyl-ACP methyl ester carboxylesterase